MKTALCLGGGASLFADIAAYKGPIDGAVACNDAGVEYPGKLDAWCSLHSPFFAGRGWIKQRALKGHPAAERVFGHLQAERHGILEGVELIDYFFPGQTGSGSSGLFCVKIALEDLGFDRVVLCGIGLSDTPHFFDQKDWKACQGFRKAWLDLDPDTRSRIRSMSGWTKVLFGSPKDETTYPENKGSRP